MGNLLKTRVRGGATLIEVTVALVVLAAAMLALAQMVTLVARQRRLTEARRMALQEVANQAERVAVMAWDEAAPDKLTAWEPSTDLLAGIPAAQCAIEVTDEPGPPTARRVRLEVRWTDAAGHPLKPAGLTLWKFAEGQP
jgi:type II secretory pathway pseudopilin PulG